MAHVDETDHVAVKSEDIKIEVKTDPDVSNTNLIHDIHENTTKSELNNSNEIDNATVLDSENLRNNRIESDLKPMGVFKYDITPFLGIDPPLPRDITH